MFSPVRPYGRPLFDNCILKSRTPYFGPCARGHLPATPRRRRGEKNGKKTEHADEKDGQITH